MIAQPHQQTQQIQAGPNYESRLGILEAAVSNIGSQLKGISDRLDQRSGINWAPISILVMVLSLVSGGAAAFLNMGQSRLEALITKQELRAERYVPREDLDARFHVVAQRRDDLQRLTDDRVARLERDFDNMQKSIVSRGEHEQTWAAQRIRDDGLQRQLDQARKDLSDLNTPRDTIQGMQRRIEELDRAIRSEPRR